MTIFLRQCLELSDEFLKLWYLPREIKQNYMQNTIINVDFSELHGLEFINLFNEGFTFIHGNTFVEFKNARNLNLNSNNLKCIEANGFLGMDKLEQLNLSHNNPKLFEALESGSFNGLSALVGLNISHHNKLWVWEISVIVFWWHVFVSIIFRVYYNFLQKFDNLNIYLI